MKMPVRPWVLLTAALLQTASAARTQLRTKVAAEEHETGKTGLHATIRSMVSKMIEREFTGDGKGPGTKEIVSMASSRMNFGEAVKQLDGKLPADIAALVRVGTRAHGGNNPTTPEYNDDSLQKARVYLNGMMLEGWNELDNVMFECMDFRKRNRGTYNQVVDDLSRLGKQISALVGKKSAAIAGISQQASLYSETTQTKDDTTNAYEDTKSSNEAEMTTRKNDLAVFDFMLNLTSCDYKAPSSLLQSSATSPKMKVCDGEMHFADAKLQARMESMMTPAARRALRTILGETTQKAKVSLLQQSSRQEPDTIPVSEEPHPEGQWKKCIDGPVACGMLHDLMSLEWGKFRDSFDELTAEMNKNDDEYNTLMINLNAQLLEITDAQTEHQNDLAETTSLLNADQNEESNKEDEKHTLTEEFDRKCQEFREKMSEILHTKICAVRKVRNELMTYSSTTPLSAISDCDFTDWHSKSGLCETDAGKEITCDDSCRVNVPFDEYDPNQCGGKEDMKRDIVVSPNENGMLCPPMERQRRCGQHLCPVHCEVSMWSGWSKCSKDCEGGVESKTRSILVKAKNGGTGCPEPVYTQSCNTGSCDRDCQLSEWTDWTYCSQACDKGYRQRVKNIVLPIRGDGKCAGKDDWGVRLFKEYCNEQACHGDEICIAKQDLIIALDGSGSVREEGFNVLREFTVNLTKRYMSEYFGAETVKMGLVLFGNGRILAGPTGTIITPAIELSELTTELDDLRTKAREATYQRGFTNMAQALSMADVLLQQGGREDAQSAVLVISDGKYSFKYQTAEKVQELKDKNVQIYMSPVIEYEPKEFAVLKEWASKPWETNYQLIPGLQVLSTNQEMYIQKLVVKFCPDSVSPGALAEWAMTTQYMMIREGQWPHWTCSPWYTFRNRRYTVEECAEAAKERYARGFAISRGGKCEAHEIPRITQDEWNTWLVDRVDPDPCKDKGFWVVDHPWDTYIFNPNIYDIEIAGGGGPQRPA